MSFRSFEELETYKSCRKLRIEVSHIVKTSFPDEEKYLLKKQILGSSRSVTANIAEGFGRFHHQENIQFCRIARGSLTETLEHLITANDEGYIPDEILQNVRLQYQNCLKLLNGYIAYLNRAKGNSK